MITYKGTSHLLSGITSGREVVKQYVVGGGGALPNRFYIEERNPYEGTGSVSGLTKKNISPSGQSWLAFITAVYWSVGSSKPKHKRKSILHHS